MTTKTSKYLSNHRNLETATKYKKQLAELKDEIESILKDFKLGDKEKINKIYLTLLKIN